MIDAAWNSGGFLVLVVSIALLVLVARRWLATRHARKPPPGMNRHGAAGKATLGSYEIECELGKGALGTVCRGRDPATGRVAAIKKLVLSEKLAPAELETARQRFFREVEAARRLAHPGIVSIYGVGEEHRVCYIAMELVEGADLVAHTKQTALLPPARVLSIIERVAEALAYAHAMGVVHRDIKPANILYAAATDTVKVTDFGIARSGDASLARPGAARGTPSYMSPEQLAGRSVDGRSDLFSLGVTLYQLLSGRLPFEGESMTKLASAIANDPHLPVSQHNAAMPSGVDAIVDRALAKDPRQRFQSGAELAEAIRQVRMNAGAAADAAA